MEAEIRAGMDLLDEVRPGWENEVNLKKLDQAVDEWSNDDCGCVLVHVFGNFQDGLDELYTHLADVSESGHEYGEEDGEEYGFMLESDWSTNDELAVGYWTLTRLWKLMIRERYVSTNYGSDNA